MRRDADVYVIGKLWWQPRMRVREGRGIADQEEDGERLLGGAQCLTQPG